jgi:hypothetical protein
MLANAPASPMELDKLPSDPVEIKQSNEPWSEYKLADGSTLRVKNVVISVVRVRGTYDPGGNPTYLFKHASIMDVTAPQKLKKK